MNDNSTWVDDKCLDEYMELVSQELPKGKGEGSAGKPARSAGKGSAGKSARQRAQQLKKQRVIKVINDIARSKPLFMSFARHPCMQTPEGFGLLLAELEEYKKTSDYQELAKQSQKMTEERTTLNRKRTYARFRLKLGQRDVNQKLDTELAKSFRAGVLARECAAAEAECSTRKLAGPARPLGDRLPR